MLLRFAKNFAAAGMSKLGHGIAVPKYLEQPQRAHRCKLTRRLRNVKACAHMALARQVINLGWLRAQNQSANRGRVIQVAIVQKERAIVNRFIHSQMIQTRTNCIAVPTHQAMHRIPLVQQMLRQVTAILPVIPVINAILSQKFLPRQKEMEPEIYQLGIETSPVAVARLGRLPSLTAPEGCELLPKQPSWNQKRHQNNLKAHVDSRQREGTSHFSCLELYSNHSSLIDILELATPRAKDAENQGQRGVASTAKPIRNRRAQVRYDSSLRLSATTSTGLSGRTEGTQPLCLLLWQSLWMAKVAALLGPRLVFVFVPKRYGQANCRRSLDLLFVNAAYCQSHSAAQPKRQDRRHPSRASRARLVNVSLLATV